VAKTDVRLFPSAPKPGKQCQPAMNFEFNKISAAVLVAGIVTLATGILSDKLFHGGGHHGDAEAPKRGFTIAEGVPVASSGAPAAPAAPVIEPVSPLLTSANAQNGAVIAKKCMTCHSFDKGGPNKVGPNLWNIVGNKHAHAEGYAYSAALKGVPGTWGYEELNHFLYKPGAYVKGTKMAFAGLPKVQDRADLLAYLRTLSDSPQPLPAAGQ
jgi:cytochrome c